MTTIYVFKFLLLCSTHNFSLITGHLHVERNSLQKMKPSLCPKVSYFVYKTIDTEWSLFDWQLGIY